MENTERAKWKVLATAGFFGSDDHLYPEDKEIFYDGPPNMELEPLNETARTKMVAYLENLDKLGKEAAEKAGRPFVGLPRTLDGGLAIATAVQKADMAWMGAKKEVTNIEAVDEETVPSTGGVKKRGRPRLNIA